MRVAVNGFGSIWTRRFGKDAGSRTRFTPSFRKRFAMRVAGKVFAHRALYGVAVRFARFLLRVLPRPILYGPWNGWGRRRELPAAPPESFRDAWRRTRGGHHG